MAQIDVSPLQHATPFEGMGSSDLLTHDGVYQGRVQKVKAQVLKDKEALLLSIVVTDADNAGRRINRNVFLSGRDKNGDPMIRQFAQLLFGAGFAQEEIARVGASGVATTEQLLGMVQQHIIAAARPVHFRAKASMVETATHGTVPMSDIRDFIQPAEYADAVKIGAHRSDHGLRPNMAQPQAAPSASGLGLPGAPAAGAGLGGLLGPGGAPTLPGAGPNGAALIGRL